jgi:hypothetical protein
MRRNVTLEEISDGRLYGLNDMVKADCQNCSGCSKCCHDMVDTIILTPLDMYNITKACGKTAAEFMKKEMELNIINGIVLPNLKMQEDTNACAFLDENGRCSVHSARPDLCRLFPLGRIYEGGDFKYFLQTDQCGHVRTKIKVEKWIDTPEPKKNKPYVLRWHDLLDKAQELVADSGDDIFNKRLNMAFLNNFYFHAYDFDSDFYPQFDERADKMESIICTKVIV